jgi:hypothetical protein
MTLTNPFPIPDPNDPNTLTVKDFIRMKFNEDGKMEFHYILKHIESALEKKDILLAKIECYYACNIILSSDHFKSDDDRREIMEGLMKQILDIEYNNTVIQ